MAVTDLKIESFSESVSKMPDNPTMAGWSAQRIKEGFDASAEALRVSLNGLIDHVGEREEILDNKVDKEEGKGLSKNDYTDEDKARVAEITSKADKLNVIAKDTIVAFTPTLPTHPANKGYVDNAINEKVLEAGAGDMAQAVYDPQGKKRDVFSAFVNPNLLDNWCFIHPVNQRGETEVTTTVNYQYFIDRWMIYYAGSNAEVTDGGVKLAAPAGNYTSLVQRIENGGKLMGKTVTVSALYGNGDLLTATGTVTETEENAVFAAASNAGNDRVVRLAYTPVNGVYAEFRVGAGLTETVKAIKLELGDTQTLAHEENGAWVLNEIPNYADQLAACQRYQYVLNAKKDASYQFTTSEEAYSSSVIYAFVPLPVTLRTKPAVTFDGNMSAENGSTYINVTGCSVFSHQAGGVTLRIDASGLTAGKAYTVRSAKQAAGITPATIVLNANL